VLIVPGKAGRQKPSWYNLEGHRESNFKGKKTSLIDKGNELQWIPCGITELCSCGVAGVI
jgi:hypothetical protein